MTAVDEPVTEPQPAEQPAQSQTPQETTRTIVQEFLDWTGKGGTPDQTKQA